ncbi:MAG: hypothetical protein MJ063_04670 [Lachnospiraceae bacterium]|nr:hypothetical protein [Lachnospiraceae bacterium]
MRKSTKIAVVLAAAALLVAGFAFTTLAKGWVKEAEGLYYYEDEYGMKVYNEWKKDTDANGKVNYYYLGDDGYMVTDSIVEYNDEKYWVGADGAKVTEQWIKVPADQEDIDNYDVDYRWYYFQKSNGKAYKGVKKDIEGNTYFFNAEGKMLFGYVNGDDFTMETDVAKAYDGNSYKYFCGSNDEGKALKSEWRKETSTTDNGAYETDTSWWAFYQSNGKRADSTLANGALWKSQRYYFDPDGKMLKGWQTATVDTADKEDDVAYYFGGADDGKKVKKAWAYVVPQSGDDKDNETKRWFYFDNTGAALKKNGVQKINGKFYAFAAAEDNASKMLAGTVKLTFAVAADSSSIVTDATAAEKIDLSKKTLDEWLAEGPNPEGLVGANYVVYYFSGDEANDGSLKKNVTFSQEFKDDTYTLAVGNDGALKDGYMKKEKKYYRYGYLLAASEDTRYEVKDVYFNGSKFALLGVAGTEVTTGTVVDADGSYYYVVKATATEAQKIYKAESSLLSAAKVISSFKKDGKGAKCSIDGVDYKVTVDDTKVDSIGYIILGLSQ